MSLLCLETLLEFFSESPFSKYSRHVAPHIFKWSRWGLFKKIVVAETEQSQWSNSEESVRSSLLAKYHFVSRRIIMHCHKRFRILGCVFWRNKFVMDVFLYNLISMVLTFHFDLHFISEIPFYSTQHKNFVWGCSEWPKSQRWSLLSFKRSDSFINRDERADQVYLFFSSSPLRYLCAIMVQNYAMFWYLIKINPLVSTLKFTYALFSKANWQSFINISVIVSIFRLVLSLYVTSSVSFRNRLTYTKSRVLLTILSWKTVFDIL
jgi:hypothetical protein